MKDLIKKNINGRKILLLFILTSIIYTIMLTITIPKVMSFSNGMKLLDMMPTGYNSSYVNLLLDTLGENGRNAYLFNQIPLDMIYPFLFGISYCLILAYFLKKIGKLEGRLFYICFLPLLAGLFDYCENIGIITILISYPDNHNILAQITDVFSILKSLSTTISLTLLIIILTIWGSKELFMKDKLPNR